jgi:hypothetical protein
MVMIEGEGLLLAIKLGAAAAALSQVGRVWQYLFQRRYGKHLTRPQVVVSTGQAPNSDDTPRTERDGVFTMHVKGVKVANYTTSSS